MSSSFGPKRIGELVSKVLVTTGGTALVARMELEEAWRSVVDERTQARTQVGQLRRGVLEILVDQPALLAELEGFQKETLLAQLKEKVKHSAIRGLRFRRAD